MNLFTRIAFALLLVLSVCGAQEIPAAPLPTTSSVAAPVIAYQPQFFVAATAGFQQTAPQAQGGLTFGVKVSDLNFTYTTLSMTSKTSSLGQGFGRYLIQTNGITLAALADIGVATGNGSVGSALGVGGSISYNISKWTKVEHTAFIATVKCDKSSGADVRPVISFGVVLGLGK